MAGAVGGFLFASFIGHILQLSHGDYSILFIIAASTYLVSLFISRLLAPGLKKAALTYTEVDLWSFEGRIGRGRYWARLILLNIGGLFAGFLIFTVCGLSRYLENYVALAMIPVYIASIWFAVATQIKRWHDLGYSGWMVLLNFTIIAIPFTVIFLGCFRGAALANKFGSGAVVGGTDGDR
jgi:uncharacterized membrane protein YhaH (DUF805 family)